MSVQHLRCPVLGDPLYGDPSRNKQHASTKLLILWQYNVARDAHMREQHSKRIRIAIDEAALQALERRIVLSQQGESGAFEVV